MKIISILFFFLLNTALLNAQSRHIYDREVLRLDSILGKGDTIEIKDNKTLIFLKFIHSIDNRCLYDFIITSRMAILLKNGQKQKLMHFLRDNRNDMIAKMDYIITKKFTDNSFKKVDIHKQYAFFSLYYLDNTLNKNVLNFAKLYKHHIRSIRKNAIPNNQYHLNKNDWYFMCAFDDMTNNNSFDVHLARIEKIKLDNTEKWCMENKSNKEVEQLFLNSLCKYILFEEFYIEIL